MSQETKKRIGQISGVALFVGLIAVTLMGTGGGLGQEPRPAVREVLLEARDATFNGEGANPDIEARVGERIRIVVRNTDTGVLHSISVPELSKEVKHVPWGEEEVLEVTASAPGTYEYRCPQHCPLMKGKLIVRP